MHSLHHKSYNPGVWSGFAMHPFEQATYLMRAGLPLFFAHHPIHYLYMLIRAMLSPVTGHHGFSEPGGSLSHYIHHAKFECNYGTSRVVPLDHLLGTQREAADGSEKGARPDAAAAPWVLGLPYLAPLWATALATGM